MKWVSAKNVPRVRRRTRRLWLGVGGSGLLRRQLADLFRLTAIGGGGAPSIVIDQTQLGDAPLIRGRVFSCFEMPLGRPRVRSGLQRADEGRSLRKLGATDGGVLGVSGC